MKALALKEAFRQNQAVIGTWVFEFNSSGIARLLASTGVDFVVYDMEHSGFGMDSIKALLSQSRPLDLAVLVRPPAGEYHLIGPLLDAGANGIIVPKVESAREAERIADACRYFPLGHRGAAFSISHDDYLSGNIPQKMKAANDGMICGRGKCGRNRLSPGCRSHLARISGSFNFDGSSRPIQSSSIYRGFGTRSQCL